MMTSCHENFCGCHLRHYYFFLGYRSYGSDTSDRVLCHPFISVLELLASYLE